MGSETEGGAKSDDRQEYIASRARTPGRDQAGAPVREAAALMSKPHTDLIVVCDHGDMVGILTKTVTRLSTARVRREIYIGAA
jgi:hypothetical protein